MLMKKTSLCFLVAAALLRICSCTSPQEEGAATNHNRFFADVTEVPAEIRTAYDLDPFYRRYVDATGIPVVSSDAVSRYALLEAAYIASRLLENRPDVVEALRQKKVRIVVMGAGEFTTDLPEYKTLKPQQYWDGKRSMGLSTTGTIPLVCCCEENLLCYHKDPFHGESVLIHEIAHALLSMELFPPQEEVTAALKRLFTHAVVNGLWTNTAAASGYKTYWAEGVQSWFDANREYDHLHNAVNTKKELQDYDPALARLIEKRFGKVEWRYSPPGRRYDKRHLKGFEQTEAHTFSWREGIKQTGARDFE